MTTQVSTNPQAERFRSQARTLATRIGELMRPRRDNTPKRAREAASAHLDAQNLARLAAAYIALADGHDAGTLPPELAALRTRDDIERKVTKCIESSGYYNVHEGKDYRDNSPTAYALRGYIESRKTDTHREQEAAAAEALKIAALEREVRFADIPGFFPTPPALIQKMMDAADCDKGMKVLEPSAGKGDILAALHAAGCNAVEFELNYTLAGICTAKGLRCERCDFLDMDPEPILDRVVMNPPFEQYQDAKHVRRAFDWLKPGGRIVAIVGAGCLHAARCEWFRDWLSEVGAVVDPQPAGSFADAFNPTGVNVALSVIDK